MTHLGKTEEIVRRGIASGLHLGAQLYVSVDGQRVAEIALGESRLGAPMTPETLVLWLSSTKPVVAALALQLQEQGRLDIDLPVATYVPEFAANGKERVTVRHLLTHTCGFRWVDIGWPQTTWPQIIARLCAAKLERGWVPGEKAGYHPFTSWHILGEVIERVTKTPLSRWVRERIFEPLGMNDSWIGMPADRYVAYGERIGVLADTEKPDRPPHRYSSERGVTDCVPGANGYGPMRELGRFYEMLLGDGEYHGVRILSTETVREMTSRQREGLFDETFKHKIDWGLGFIINSNRYGDPATPYGYGPHAADATFGHSGSMSSVAFADPVHRLVVATYFNGTPGERRHHERIQAVCAAIYVDLGFADEGQSPLASQSGKATSL